MMKHGTLVMRLRPLFLVWGFLAAGRLCAQTPRDFAIDLSATVSTNTPCITLNWSIRRLSNITGQKIHRRLKGESVWVKQADLITNQTSYADGTAVKNVEYEYWMERTYTGVYPTTAMGYLSAGVNVPMAESRGTLLLVVDNTMAAPLAPEIAQLQADLACEGWTVQTLTAYRTNTAANVKAQIAAAYAADPSNVKMVYLLGHVPVPYSGNVAPDGHSDHAGAWPADGYYGEMNGPWTDSTVNNTSAADSRNDNVPGDGKFDQNNFPSAVELMVGRVDLQGMTRAPASAVSEAALLRRYLRKAHDFRMKQGAYAAVPRRSMLRDGFGYFSGENFAIAGWSWAFTGAGSLVDEPLSGQWFSGSYAGGQTYLIGYGNGGGSYTSADTVGCTEDFGLKPSRAVFTSLFGSYFGDWDTTNNFLRAPLAGNATADSLGLTCFWGGRPNRFMHHLGMGETAGYGMRVSQNGSLSGGGGYAPNNYAGAHTALMGDPALRLYAVEPPRNLSAVSSNSLVALAWTASTETNLLGYHVYRAGTAAGPFTRLTAAPQASNAYADAAVTVGQSYSYMVRTLKRETVPGGSFDNPSVGSLATVTVSAGAFAAPRNPGSLTVTPRASTNAVLAWADTSGNETGFRIERMTNAAGSFVTVGSVAANVTQFSDPGAFLSGNVYYYRVVATHASGDSAPSNIASFDAVAGFFDLPVTRLKVDKSAGFATVSVSRLGGSNGVASVSFATSNSSAFAGTHYVATNGTLTWADGDAAAKTISVALLNTAAPQAARQFTLGLSSPSGGASLSVNTSAAVLIEDATAALGAPWSQTVLNGITDSSSAVTVSNAICSVTLGGAGVAAASTYEAGQFIYQNRTGDGVLTAYFPAGLPSDGGARYALTVRASTAGTAVMAAAVASSSASHGSKFVWRSATGGGAEALPVSANALVLARWLRLTRMGNVFSAETSADGASWTLLGSATLPAMPATAAWGVFHYSTDGSVSELGNFHLAVAESVALADVPVPEAPGGFSASAASSSAVSLTWALVANAAGYRIERRGESGAFAQIADVSAGAGVTQTLVDAAVAADTGYVYRVLAYNGSGASGYSSAVTVATPQADSVVQISAGAEGGADAAVRLDLPSTPLGTATNLSVAGYDPDTWDVLTNAAKSYLRFNLAGQAPFAKATLKLAFLSEERFDEAGYFNLYAYALGESAELWSESAITWNNAPQNNLTGVGFLLPASQLASTNFFEIPAAGEVCSFALSAPALNAATGANSLVTIGLCQYSGGAISHWASREQGAYAAPTLELSSPSLLLPRPVFLSAAVESGWAVTLRWTECTSDETGFDIERRLTNGVFSLVQTLSSNAVSCVDATAEPGAAYVYRVRAFNASGPSSWAVSPVVVTPDVFHAVGTVWDGGGGNSLLSTPGNWDVDLTPAFNGSLYLNFGTGGSVATVNTNVGVLGLNLLRDADFTFAAGGGSLVLGAGGLRAEVPTAESRTYTLAAAVTLAADQSWACTNNGAGVTTLVVSGPVTDGSSSFGLTKSGAGVLTLAGSNSYDGVTVVATGGVLRVAHSFALGSTNGATTAMNGGWLEVTGNVSVAEALTLGSDASVGGAGTLRSTGGTNAWSGRITQAASTRIRALAGSSLALSGGVAGSYDLVLSPDAGGAVAVAGGVAIGSSRKLIASGAGVAAISGSGHTFGTLEVAGSTARTESPNTLPSTTILSIGTSAAPDGVFDLWGNSQTVGQLKRGVSAAGARAVTSAQPATLTVNGSTSTAFDGQLSGALSLVKSGTATLTLSGTNNTYSGSTDVAGGTLDVSASTSLGSSEAVSVTGGTLLLRNASALPDTATLSLVSPGKVRLVTGTEAVGALYLGGARQRQGTYGSTASTAEYKSNTYFDSTGTGLLSVAAVPAGTVWDGGAGADARIDSANNWDTDWVPLFDGTATLAFGSGGLQASVNTNVALLGMVLNRDADFEVADGGATLTLGRFGVSACPPSETSRTYTLSARVALATNQAWCVTNTGTGAACLLVSGPISDGSSAFGLAKAGSGALVLSGSNSYDGATSVASGGVLRVAHACALGSTNGATTVEKGGWLEVTGSVAIAEPLTAGGRGAGGDVLSTAGTNVWSGRLTQAASTCVRCLAGSRLTLSGGVAGPYDLVLSPDAGSSVALSGGVAIGGGQKLVANGAGVVAVSGAGHTFGALEVAGVTVRTESPNTLPSATILAIGSAYSPDGVFDLSGNSQTVGQLKRGISAAGVRVVTSAAPATLTVSGGTSTLYDGQLAGALSLVKAGASELTLSGANNTYGGSTVVVGGTLTVGASAALDNSPTVSVIGGTLRLQGTNGIPDTAVLSIADGATVRVDAGADTVASLYLGGVRARRGTWGAAGSGAQHVDGAHFSASGGGVIQVRSGTESVLMVR